MLSPTSDKQINSAKKGASNNAHQARYSSI